ncbi:MAG: Asp23/Gls24 family envelope stress response protein [Lachnospiraceae bacterium]|nr:Asp23/Gls24 family envelope stress response protein [Lachnospiraceae bacterium]
MADERKMFVIKDGPEGGIKVADEVVSNIAVLAATEVEGVDSMAGNITDDIVSKIGLNKLSKGVNISVKDDKVKVELSINIAYGYEIPKVSSKVQEKVKSAIETMTGLEVTQIDIDIASVANA